MCIHTHTLTQTHIHTRTHTHTLTHTHTTLTPINCCGKLLRIIKNKNTNLFINTPIGEIDYLEVSHMYIYL